MPVTRVARACTRRGILSALCILFHHTGPLNQPQSDTKINAAETLKVGIWVNLRD